MDGRGGNSVCHRSLWHGQDGRLANNYLVKAPLTFFFSRVKITLYIHVKFCISAHSNTCMLK